MERKGFSRIRACILIWLGCGGVFGCGGVGVGGEGEGGGEDSDEDGGGEGRGVGGDEGGGVWEGDEVEGGDKDAGDTGKEEGAAIEANVQTATLPPRLCPHTTILAPSPPFLAAPAPHRSFAYLNTLV